MNSGGVQVDVREVGILHVHAGGWASVVPNRVGGSLSLRLSETDGAVRIVGLHLEIPAGVTGNALRTLPLGRVEAAVNQPETLERVRTLISEPRPFLEGLSVSPGASSAKVAGGRRRKVKRLELKFPSGARKPDAFYQSVASLYLYLRVLSDRPAADIAEANGVPVTTVHRWVKEARRRGFLPPAPRKRSAERGT